MNIAILGSAPSSLGLAPFADPTWAIWGCSPGVFPHCPRVDEWFEVHRPEFGVIGKPHTQKPWFSPEYVAWMGKQKRVWMHHPVPEIPNSEAYPIELMLNKFSSYFFTSSVSLMLAMAIDQILASREKHAKAVEVALASGVKPEELAPITDRIGLWGVDMAATEEYGYQRAGTQYFLGIASTLGIEIIVPPESDLLRPMPVYGLCENTHWMIKSTARREELHAKLQAAEMQLENAKANVAFLRGAIDDHKYHMDTWCEDRPMTTTHHEIFAQSPAVQEAVRKLLPPKD